MVVEAPCVVVDSKNEFAHFRIPKMFKLSFIKFGNFICSCFPFIFIVVVTSIGFQYS